MYLDALEFLEEERDAWAPYEALSTLTDDQLEQPIDAAHGWSGRDLMAHMLAWQGIALEIAMELAVNETSPTIARVDAEWDAKGDAFNDEIQADLGRSADGRDPRVVADAARRAARLPDGRARDPLGQARGASQDVPRRDDRPLRGARPGAGGGARGGSGVTQADGGRPPLADDDTLTLADVLAEAAETLDEVSATVETAGGVLWDRAGRAFAAVGADGASAEFRLDGAVADAARRTPDTGSSRRGVDWVRFSPAELDDHALDRAEAWFGSAWRRAERP